MAVQDTAKANCNTRLKAEGIGYISDKTLGVSIHGCLAVSCDGLFFVVSGQSGYKRNDVGGGLK
jgi:hypothetical protein